MFENRFDAAEKLLPLLEHYKANPDTIILAIPRGGLELGYVLARGLELPLDVIFTKKIGLPEYPEYAIGAVSDAHVFLASNFKDIPDLQEYIAHEVEEIRNTIKERTIKYRRGMPPFNIQNKTVIVIDDGIATGSTLLATLALIKEYKPKKIVIALPVAPPDALKKIQEKADEVVCVIVPEIFYSVGQFYKHFAQVEDSEAIKLLRDANA